MSSNGDIYVTAHAFDPERLALARELRGLSKTELAELVEKSASAISQFESGRVRPDPQTVSRLALALGLPVAFFKKTTDSASFIPLDSCHWRSLRSASQRDRRRLLAAAKLLCDLVSILDEEVDFPQERVSIVSRAAKTPDEIEQCANEVRKAWGLSLGPLPNITNLLERQGILVLRIFESCREVDAFSLWHAHRPCVFLVMEKGSTSRARFDAAHELGHLVMHADVAPGNPDYERQANRFAGAFLFPRESFLAEWPRWLNWPHLEQLKQRWKMSYAAMLKRAFDLGCLSEASYRRAFVYLNKTGLRQRETFEPPDESPGMIAATLKLLAEDWPMERIAGELSISAGDLRALVAGVTEGCASSPPDDATPEGQPTRESDESGTPLRLPFEKCSS